MSLLIISYQSLGKLKQEADENGLFKLVDALKGINTQESNENYIRILITIMIWMIMRYVQTSCTYRYLLLIPSQSSSRMALGFYVIPGYSGGKIKLCLLTRLRFKIII